ncbi:MAG: hypothetical protein DRQ54_10095 [Gammaproteobacteria bacterium]|nr:MAG: hypothetical protein DRQ54_10095 [Gammaproteobacteria bacterium]
MYKLFPGKEEMASLRRKKMKESYVYRDPEVNPSIIPIVVFSPTVEYPDFWGHEGERWGSRSVPIPKGGDIGQVLTKAADFQVDGNGEPIPDPSYDPELPHSADNLKYLVSNTTSDYQCKWADFTTPDGMPSGGSTGQVMQKVDEDDFNVEWVSPQTIPDGDGDPIGYALRKTNSAARNYDWAEVYEVPSDPTTTGWVLTATDAIGGYDWGSLPDYNEVPAPVTDGYVLTEVLGSYQWEALPTYNEVPADGVNVGYVLTDLDGLGGYGWSVIPNQVPDGGINGQVLAKVSITDQDFEWITLDSDVITDDERTLAELSAMGVMELDYTSRYDLGVPVPVDGEIIWDDTTFSTATDTGNIHFDKQDNSSRTIAPLVYLSATHKIWIIDAGNALNYLECSATGATTESVDLFTVPAIIDSVGGTGVADATAVVVRLVKP